MLSPRNSILSLYSGKEPDNAQYFYDSFINMASDIFKSPVDILSVSNDINNSDNMYKNVNDYEYIIVPLFIKVKMKTGTVGMNITHSDFINYLTKVHNKKVVVISFGNPYLLSNFEDVSGYIAAYGDAKSVIDAVINTISGKNNPKGKLPITISGEYKFGYGLSYK